MHLARKVLHQTDQRHHPKPQLVRFASTMIRQCISRILRIGVVNRSALKLKERVNTL